MYAIIVTLGERIPLVPQPPGASVASHQHGLRDVLAGQQQPKS